MFRALSGHVVYAAETPEMVKVRAATQPAPLLRTVAPGSRRTSPRSSTARWRGRRRTAGGAHRRWRLRSAPPAPSAPANRRRRARPRMAPGPSRRPRRRRSGWPRPRRRRSRWRRCQGYETPSSTDNGWIKWVAAAAAMVVLFVVGGGVLAFVLIRSASHAKPDIALKGAADVERRGVTGPGVVPRSHLGQSRGARHHRRVLGVPVPVLCARGAHARATEEHLRPREAAPRVEEPAAVLPREREARRRGWSGRLRARRVDRVLQVPRPRIQEPGAARARELPALGDRRGHRRQEVRRAIAAHTAAAKIDEDQALAKKIGANGTPRSGSTASSSRARSRSTGSSR